jgi:hypothetical protein
MVFDGSEPYSGFSTFDDLEEAQRAYASSADGVLAAVLPVDEQHPAVAEEYVAAARFDKTYRKT